MKRRWLRLEPGRKENLIAASVAVGAAAGIAAVIFYFARIFLSREEVGRLEEQEGRGRSRALSPPEGASTRPRRR